MIFQLVVFTVGLLLLYNGAEWLVDGSASLAKKIGLSPMLIGLTVVAFGTSTPELIVSLVSLYLDKSMIAIGNVVGSNICNLTMVLGITALIKPVSTNKTVLNRDIPVMLFASACLFVISLNSVISKLDGLLLLVGGIAYVCFNYATAKNDNNLQKANIINCQISKHKNKSKTYQIKTQITIIFIGIISLVAGAELLVNSAIKIMLTFGISEKCIGLTVVALGTSVPELATSIVAIMKKQMDISIGNLVGSNVFNILSVIGITATVQPITMSVGFIKSELIVDYIVMILTSSLPLLLMRKNQNITKRKGLMLLGFYIIYIIVLFSRT